MTYFGQAAASFALMVLMLGFSLWGFRNKKFFLQSILHPASVVNERQFYRFFTSDLVHNDWIHLLLNEFMMYICCVNLEIYLSNASGHGHWYFLLIFLASNVSGALYVTVRHSRDFEYAVAGASGSIMGCMFSYMMLQPHIIAFYLPVVGGVENIFAGLIYILLLIRLQFKNKSAYSHELHFFGALGGILSTLALFPNILRF